jgi:predicted dinucleotide-binding enzyme
VPLKAYRALPAEPFAGRIVVDANNYYPQRDGQIAELDAKTATSTGLLARHLDRARVLKAFNTIYFEHLRDRGDTAAPAADRFAIPIAGDDAEAKAEVSAFLDSIGYDAYDAGSLADSWRFDVGTPAYGRTYNTDTTGAFPPPPDSGRQTTAETMREALAAATR